MLRLVGSAVTRQLNPKVSAISLTILFTLIYVICVLWGLLLPSYSMNILLTALLPGYVENSLAGFILGLAESAFYGLAVGYGYASIYNWTATKFPV